MVRTTAEGASCAGQESCGAAGLSGKPESQEASWIPGRHAVILGLALGVGVAHTAPSLPRLSRRGRFPTASKALLSGLHRKPAVRAPSNSPYISTRPPDVGNATGHLRIQVTAPCREPRTTSSARNASRTCRQTTPSPGGAFVTSTAVKPPPTVQDWTLPEQGSQASGAAGTSPRLGSPQGPRPLGQQPQQPQHQQQPQQPQHQQEQEQQPALAGVSCPTSSIHCGNVAHGHPPRGAADCKCTGWPPSCSRHGAQDTFPVASEQVCSACLPLPGGSRTPAIGAAEPATWVTVPASPDAGQRRPSDGENASVALYRRCLPYNPHIRRRNVFCKIPGYEPSQISPGYEQRLAQLVTCGDPDGSCGAPRRRLGSVYVRAGCVELLLEEEEWGMTESCGSSAAADLEELEEDDEGAVGEAAGGAESAATRRRQAAVPRGEPQPAMEFRAADHRGADGPRGAVAWVEGSNVRSGWPDERPGLVWAGTREGEARVGASAAASARSYRPGRSQGSRSSSISTMDLAAIIQALQLRDEPEGVTSAEEDGDEEVVAATTVGSAVGWARDEQCGDEVASSGGIGGGGGGSLKLPHSNEAEAGQQSLDSSAPAAVQPSTTNGQQTAADLRSVAPFLLGVEGEAQTGVRVVALHPRVLLIAPVPPAPQPSSLPSTARPLARSPLPPAAGHPASGSQRDASAAQAHPLQQQQPQQQQLQLHQHAHMVLDSESDLEPESDRYPGSHADVDLHMSTSSWITNETVVGHQHPVHDPQPPSQGQTQSNSQVLYQSQAQSQSPSSIPNQIQDQARDQSQEQAHAGQELTQQTHGSLSNDDQQRGIDASQAALQSSRSSATGWRADGDAPAPLASATSTPSAAAATLRAAVQCSSAVTVAEGAGGLEILLRSHGRYLPVGARWCCLSGGASLPGTSPPAGYTDEGVAGVGARLTSDDGGDEDGVAGAPVPPPRGAAVAGAVVPLPLPDAAMAEDVNRLQLLQLELLELPSRPGIALVDLRYLGRPCRAVPLVLTAQSAVAAELRAAAASWTRPQAELDELLLDYGTWEFHVHSAVRSLPHSAPPWTSRPWGAFTQSAASGAAVGAAATGPAAAAATTTTTTAAVASSSGGSSCDGGDSGSGRNSPQQLSAARLLDLSAHLLRYVSACGWVNTAAYIRSQMCRLSGSRTYRYVGPTDFATAAAAAADATEAAAANDEGTAQPPPQQQLPGPWALAPSAPGTAARLDAASATMETGTEVAMPAAVTAAAAMAEGDAPKELAQQPEETAAEGGGGTDGENRATLSCGSGGGGGTVAAAGGNEVVEGDGSGLRDDGGPRQLALPWMTAVLLPALGFDRSTAAEAEAFKQYIDLWVLVLSPILVLFDLCCLIGLLLRQRHESISASSVSLLVATSMSIVLVLSWIALPYTMWVWLLRFSRYGRVAAYCAAKGLVAYGFAVPPGVETYARGPTRLLMEGVVLPVASMMSPAGAAVSLSLLAAATSGMLLQVGALSRLEDAVLHGVAAAALGVATTVACQAYLRYHFWQHPHPHPREGVMGGWDTGQRPLGGARSARITLLNLTLWQPWQQPPHLQLETRLQKAGSEAAASCSKGKSKDD